MTGGEYYILPIIIAATFESCLIELDGFNSTY